MLQMNNGYDGSPFCPVRLSDSQRPTEQASKKRLLGNWTPLTLLTLLRRPLWSQDASKYFGSKLNSKGWLENTLPDQIVTMFVQPQYKDTEIHTSDTIIRKIKIFYIGVTPCNSAAVYEYDGQQMTSEAITVHPPFQFGATLALLLARAVRLFGSNHQYPPQGRFQIRFFAPQNLATASRV